MALHLVHGSSEAGAYFLRQPFDAGARSFLLGGITACSFVDGRTAAKNKPCIAVQCCAVGYGCVVVVVMSVERCT